MSGIYRVNILGATLTTGTQVDLFGITNHASKACMILGLDLFQAAIPGGEVGDAQEEIMPIYLNTGHGTIGSGGPGAFTPINTDRGGGAAGFTARTMDTTKATGGTKVTVQPVGWNIRGSLDLVLPEEWQIIIPAGVLWTVETLANASGTKTIYGSLLIKEIG